MQTQIENMITATPQDTSALRANILNALCAFANQRPGLDPRDYIGGDWREGIRNYRSESRSITRDLHDFRALYSAVQWRDSITAGRLQAAFRAFSGRLTCTVHDAFKDSTKPIVTLSYCTGQYWPTEFRKAACAVLASALWDWTRDLCMPKGTMHHNSETGETLERYDGLRAGDWLRRNFRREFGAHLARRWFS